MTTETYRCEICGGAETNPALLSDCSACGALYHLNPRQDVEGKDCGDVTLGNSEVPAIQFFCNRCLERFRREIEAEGIDLGFSLSGGAPIDLAAPDAPAGFVSGSDIEFDADGLPRFRAPDGPPPKAERRRGSPRRRFRRID
jgi:hypothetical protein